MKLIQNSLSKVFAFAAFSLSSQASFAQANTISRVSKFSIEIGKIGGEEAYELRCLDGCNWKLLSFKKPVGNKPQLIDENGMTTSVSASASWVFSIQSSKKGISLVGLKGTAWSKLGFTLPKGKTFQLIDEHGMK